uniref:Serpin family E member 3 n=1 Tax=Podarcis muralis TaxID=64176 RepID=A0A670HYZ0_PODMU|nr:serpin E3 isoform X1 [Podarcis muralis]XP_028577896.1 serpin E3 isoform X1 [Podarcis muralis]
MLPFSITTLLLSLGSSNVGGCEHNHEPQNLNTEFALALYQRWAERNHGTNLAISPVSVSLSLGLLQFGAQGRTLAQLQHALGYSTQDQDVQDFLHTVYREVTNSSQSPVVAQLACALFVQAGTHLLPPFVQHAALWANNTVHQANFSEPNRTAAQIKEWFATSTGDGETSYLSLETLDSPLNQIAVVSVMSFKSTWQRKFTFTDTQTLSFTTTEGLILKVPTMYLSAEVNYGEFLLDSLERVSVVELPYLGEAVSMFVVLPSDRRTPIAEIERYLSARNFPLWSNSLRRTKMDLFLPRFRIENHLDLKMVLPTLGITDMFDPAMANFKGISEQEHLYISEATHRARIEVTEDGTKASGTTAMVLLKRSRAPVFKADRPFNFLLRQGRTGSILFIGRLTNPIE